MFIANEGKKNLEAKANFIDPRGGCGCATSSVRSMTRDSVCTCACGSSGVLNSAKTAGKNVIGSRNCELADQIHRSDEL